LIIIGIAYFGLTLWIIKTASSFFFGEGLEASEAKGELG